MGNKQRRENDEGVRRWEGEGVIRRKEKATEGNCVWTAKK